MSISQEDRRALIRDKYNGDEQANLDEDEKRLAAGEPLAYVIGWIPFLDLHIDLTSHPLIPRPETEWWTSELITHLRERFGDTSFQLLDLCAGSGAIGLAVLKAFPYAQLSFGELQPTHVEQIKQNLELNKLGSNRVEIQESDLFEKFSDKRFDLVVTNPPYIPSTRVLDSSVLDYEPQEALFSGVDGLEIIRKILTNAHTYLMLGGELWMECDIDNIQEAKKIAEACGFRATIRTDQYNRPRILIASD